MLDVKLEMATIFMVGSHSIFALIDWGLTLYCYFKYRLNLCICFNNHPSIHPPTPPSLIYSYGSHLNCYTDSATLLSSIWSLEDNSQEKWVTPEKTKDTFELHNDSQWSVPYKEPYSQFRKEAYL